MKQSNLNILIGTSLYISMETSSTYYCLLT